MALINYMFFSCANCCSGRCYCYVTDSKYFVVSKSKQISNLI